VLIDPTRPGPGKPAIRIGESNLFFFCITFAIDLTAVFPSVTNLSLECRG
jgi:hypothetical protein